VVSLLCGDSASHRMLPLPTLSDAMPLHSPWRRWHREAPFPFLADPNLRTPSLKQIEDSGRI